MYNRIFAGCMAITMIAALSGFIYGTTATESPVPGCDRTGRRECPQ